jgi:hypothetical protein
VTTEQLQQRIEIEKQHLEYLEWKRIRLLLYVASLLEASLSGPSYDEMEVKQMIQYDYYYYDYDCIVSIDKGKGKGCKEKRKDTNSSSSIMKWMQRNR